MIYIGRRRAVKVFCDHYDDSLILKCIRYNDKKYTSNVFKGARYTSEPLTEIYNRVLKADNQFMERKNLDIA